MAESEERASKVRKLEVAPAVRTPPPHPDWKPGDKQPLPFPSGFVALDPLELKSCYPLMISAYVPRPIAFISTVSEAGVGNLAPFSYSGCVGHDPPTIAVSICRNARAEDGKKDTLANIDATGEFVVCIMSEWFVESANHTCGNFPRGTDEFDESGLSRLPSSKVKPPRVGESAVHFECKLSHRHEIVNKAGVATATMVLGEVVMVHAAKDICDEAGAGEGKPTIDFARYAPLARLGGNTYGRVTSTFDLDRPDRNQRNV